jgi:hypothetical protein
VPPLEFVSLMTARAWHSGPVADPPVARVRERR